ncbi:PhzF family phenazine biosynthesis protein [Peribacillus muralis]|uniref:PhzF family phenazine biosynthesis protein n=1 Tax=Peribacillus muralis TaxID=264697 RepID=UPI001F4D43A0|nr:PhzF family phenazine biosynthesis protein [Peribacillus muralis]MCK1993732.1 PhzF family phenazine biosynthesis protein [Peribacillus muralis]MCK2013979.1 PhzF family phenazine biosynthesis protein [Peribacillus muralis]
MNNRIYFINAFSKEKFKGNPAAIVFLSEKRSEEWLKSLAAELNQPITTFIRPKGGNNYQLRWFTPINEIDLCGHGTLGAAHVLWSEGFSSSESAIYFHTQAGLLRSDLSGQQIILKFNIKESTKTEVTEKLKRVIQLPIKDAAWAEDRYILELENQDMVHKAVPNLEAIKELDGPGIIITSIGSGKYDFVSRVFAPKIGINEDYVTGSAHCALASYWGYRLNKKEFMAYQDSKRGGEIKLKIMGEKVELIGDCITLLKGELYN